MLEVYVLAHRLFGRQAKRIEPYFPELSTELVKAHLSVTREKWLAFMLFSGTLVFIVSFFIGMPFVLLIYGAGLASMLWLFVLCMAFGALAGALVFYYPTIVASERGKKIENALAFSTIYMSTISKSGFPPQEIFRLLSKFKEYGEIAVESSLIVRDTEILGLDLPAAISRAMARSPAPDWTELLAGIKTTMTIGGDLGAFLEEKSRGFIADYRRRLQDFSSFLSMLIEIYVTIVIVGAVFFIVTTSIIVAIGGVSTATIKTLNYAIVLVGIPVLTAAFLLI